MKSKNKKVLMFKNGQYIPWDGSDVSCLLTTEQITLRQLKKYFPKEYKKVVFAL